MPPEMPSVELVIQNISYQKNCSPGSLRADLTKFVNPCARGEPYREFSTGMIRFCNQGSASICPLHYWCHVGVNRDSTVCCPGGMHCVTTRKVTVPCIGEETCKLPLSIGTGDATLNRWHFNAAIKRCVHFVYRGLGGNRNNFLSKKLCQEHCTGGKACEQPQNAGLGPYGLRRWFYNKRTGACEPFVYHGTLGNANNFATEELCHGRCVGQFRRRHRPRHRVLFGMRNPCSGQPFRTTDGELMHCVRDFECPKEYYCHVGRWISSSVCCPKKLDWRNLCPQGSPYFDGSGQALRCDDADEMACPENYYCHTDADLSGGACCPAISDPCNQPIEVGTGMDNIKRWYFDMSSGQCLSFVYSGLGGNANNFMTHSECTIRCAVRGENRRKMVSSRRCPHGEPYGSNDWEPNGCKAGCPLNYRCMSMDGLAQYCCPDANAICLLPIHRGYSRCEQAPEMRFAFHASSGQCVPFEFSGCGGNLNNFGTIEFCQSQCELEHNE
ncbi:hypothetical protein M514_06585 [Trichuris suis]|uniref:BPTI/Kunitz inhibitor domain-containing protein n=1 Tax=Trichuris suis TaxID=68888 RepID=A0A085M5Q5_9BILA|nr:hypothetical protein M513_06585 [Trichuris suis]KFD63701.1 hypothetical protein M514_06585 [Trichuris suis]